MSHRVFIDFELYAQYENFMIFEFNNIQTFDEQIYIGS